MTRLLVLKPSSLGDIVHGLQLLQAVKRQRPELHVTWVVRDRFAGLVHAAPFVDEVIHFRRRDGWRGMVHVLRDIRARRFDLVWDLQGLLRSGLMTAAARAPRKIGRADAREGSGLFYHERVAPAAADAETHAIEVLLPFADTVGAVPKIDFPLALREDATFAWRDFFRGDERATFVIFTDSRGAGKEWPRFDELTALIFAQIPDARVAWCAGKPAQPAVPVPAERFLNLTGCPLDEMIALVRQRSVFIGNDSGPMHLSAASGNRVLAIFGPTSPRRFGPYPPDSTRTRAVVAPGGELARLEPAAVLAALQELRARA
jgi:ADP-heptose:LPS heptosyltransferase